ncbi:UNVERIFIED_CONTAM: DNA-directed RNA polymerase I subunit [Sesamum radiatum]|uniref:DNA-directed RNA polymerase subunit n=1 Tax=Sesamum radiatum TaxID=300843 RepID=A0AAW2KBG8_SESRA
MRGWVGIDDEASSRERSLVHWRVVMNLIVITNPNLLDILEKPIPGGLYDPAMGPPDENSPLGHADVNHAGSVHTTALVENCVYQLELITKGDMLGLKVEYATKNLQDKKNMDWVLSNDIVDPEDSQGSHTSHSDHTHYEHNSQACWDSSQLTEAMSVLNEFLKKKGRKCKNCDCNNPKLNKPTFGWFHVSGLSDTQLRSNAIRRSRLDVAHSGEGEERPSSEVVNASDYSWKDDSETVEATSFIDTSDTPKKSSKKESILVPPIKFRPPAKGGDSVMEHPQTVLLGKVLQSNIALGNARVNNAERSKIINRWMDLQQSINVLFDSKTANSQAQKDGTSGICQFLEKKEGIFRQKMMGKRVNFACRSVISPDPYLAVNEIGIPPYFALRLTYPERVTPWNAGKLRDAVINGPEIHPGATTYVDSVSTVKLPSSKKMRVAISRKFPSSRGLVSQSGKINELEFEGKFVYRHLQDGDIVLVNRQEKKTLRMHYANCSSYNADFDGDEINVHFPQDEISRAEAYNIVNANEQYIVPTKGDTVRGLIQDHIVGAVLLTLKNTFLTHSEFSQLLY